MKATGTTSYYMAQDGPSSSSSSSGGASRKRPSPLDRSPSRSSSSASYSAGSSSSAAAIATTSTATGAAARRRAPSSPTARLAPASSSSSSSPSRKRTSSANAMQQQAQAAAAAEMTMPPLTKEQINRQRALESQMQSLYELEYRDEVLQYMYEMESQTLASVELIDMQPELAWYMRPYLVDFLIEIHQQYRLRPETLYLAINIVDRYVSKRIVYKKHYQLVGCAALWIASKFEDAKDRVPTVEDLCAVCCSAYDVSAFIQMEGHVLSTIGWCLGHPTAEAWLRAACSEGPHAPMEDQRTQHVARFIMEITLFHRAFVSIKPSDIALSCLLLARFMCDSDKLYRVQQKPEVIKIAQMLDAHLAEHLEQVSSTVVKKYSPSFYSRSSSYAREWYLSGRRFHYAPLSASSHAIPEIEMMHSSPTSCSSSASGGDSEDDDEDLLECSSEDMLSSEPITPTTSICSSSSSSDPFFEDGSGGVQAHVAKFAGNQAKYLPPPVPRQVQMQYYHQQQLPQYQPTTQSAAPTPGNGVGGVGVHNWHMQVVPPSAEQSSYRS